MEKIEVRASVIQKGLRTFLFIVLLVFDLVLLSFPGFTLEIFLWMFLFTAFPMGIFAYASYVYRLTVDRDGIHIKGLFGVKSYLFKDFRGVGQYKMRYMNGAEYTVQSVDLFHVSGKVVKLPLHVAPLNQAKQIVAFLYQIYAPPQQDEAAQ